MTTFGVVFVLALLAVPAVAGAQEPRQPLPAPDLRGQLTPRRFTTLAAEVPAKVDKVAVREGERFKEGQLLVGLDCSVQRAQLDRARAVLASAEKVHAAQKRLVELKSSGALEAEAAAMKAAEARGDVAVLNATVSKCSITAPFPGRVVEQKIRDQQFVQPGNPMLDILDDGAFELEFIMPSRALAGLKVGQPFQILVEEMGRPYPARIARIGAKVDAVSQSIKVVGEIDGKFPELIAGMSGKILLTPP